MWLTVEIGLESRCHGCLEKPAERGSRGEATYSHNIADEGGAQADCSIGVRLWLGMS